MEDTDTLGRWIAHYLAEQITGLSQKTEAEKPASETEIVSLILRIWDRRQNFSNRHFPLSEVDKVEAAIARLAPGQPHWSYTGVFTPDNEPAAGEIETDVALNAALRIDRLARDLVYNLIIYAAKRAESKEATWVNHAERIRNSTLQRFKHLYLMRGGHEESPSVSGIEENIAELSLSFIKLLSSISDQI